MSENRQINFVIPGEPVAKARPRVVRLKSGAAHSYTPKETVSYENLVRICFLDEVGTDFKPMVGQFVLKVDAYFSMPKSRPKKWQQLASAGIIRPTKRPDWDNVGKIVSDALNGIAYRDDSAIVDAWIRKWYSDQPRVEVRIIDITDKLDTWSRE